MNCADRSGVEDIRRQQQQKDKTHAIIKPTRIDNSTTSVGLNFRVRRDPG